MSAFFLGLSLLVTPAAGGLECPLEDCLGQAALRTMSAATVLEAEGHTDLARGLYQRLAQDPNQPYQELAQQAIDRIDKARVARDALFSSMTTTAILTGGLVETSLLKFGGEAVAPEVHVLVGTTSALAGAYGGLLLARHFEPSLGAVELGAASAMYGFIGTLGLLSAHASGDDEPAALLLATVVATLSAAGGTYLGQRYHVHESGVRLAGTLAIGAAIEAVLILSMIGNVPDAVFTDVALLAAAGGGALGLSLSHGRALPNGRYLTLWVGGVAGALAAGSLVILTDPDGEIGLGMLAAGIGGGVFTAWRLGRHDVGEPYPKGSKPKLSFGPPMILPDRRGLAVTAPSLHLRF